FINLGDDWEVDKIVHNTETNEVDIFAKWIGKVSSDKKIYDYRELCRWRHLDTLQHKTYISAYSSARKFLWKSKSIDVPWADNMERHTFLFERCVIDLLLACKNQTQVTGLMRYGFNVVNRIIHLSAK